MAKKAEGQSNPSAGARFRGEWWLTTPARERYGASRTAWWRWQKSDPEFPAPMRPPGGAPRWNINELDSYFAQRRGPRAP